MIKKIILEMVKLIIQLIVRVEKNKILLISRGPSGSNTYALYRNRPHDLSVKLVDNKTYCGYTKLMRFINYHKDMYSSKVVVSTHGGPIIRKRKIMRYDVWHGIPLKGMVYMDKSVSKKDRDRISAFNYIDKMFSYSSIFTTLMNSCMHKSIDDYIITGAPRNDFLFFTDGRKNIKKIFPDVNIDEKILFYMPTYRKGRAFKYNILDVFDIDKLNQFLVKNNIRLICKFHPNEEKLSISYSSDYSNIEILTNSLLERNDLDLYELLNGIDLLITDYSSVYFDLLLIDIPALFTPFDLEEYREITGLILEPYEEWVCGPVVTDFGQFRNEVLESITNKDYFMEKRKRLKNIFHVYMDEKSSDRVWIYIREELNRTQKTRHADD